REFPFPRYPYHLLPPPAPIPARVPAAAAPLPRRDAAAADAPPFSAHGAAAPAPVLPRAEAAARPPHSLPRIFRPANPGGPPIRASDHLVAWIRPFFLTCLSLSKNQYAASFAERVRDPLADHEIKRFLAANRGSHF